MQPSLGMHGCSDVWTQLFTASWLKPATLLRARHGSGIERGQRRKLMALVQSSIGSIGALSGPAGKRGMTMWSGRTCRHNPRHPACGVVRCARACGDHQGLPCGTQPRDPGLQCLGVRAGRPQQPGPRSTSRHSRSSSPSGTRCARMPHAGGRSRLHAEDRRGDRDEYQKFLTTRMTSAPNVSHREIHDGSSAPRQVSCPGCLSRSNRKLLRRAGEDHGRQPRPRRHLERLHEIAGRLARAMSGRHRHSFAEAGEFPQ